ncbi:hypothetical protein, partial [Burkholderia glumae]|uniref:hypothetical protein n=1 Tax=Burkholderia glumae TaxID=337 RepID=UPI0019D6E87D
QRRAAGRRARRDLMRRGAEILQFAFDRGARQPARRVRCPAVAASTCAPRSGAMHFADIIDPCIRNLAAPADRRRTAFRGRT